jgi:hypothetical protein
MTFMAMILSPNQLNFYAPIINQTLKSTKPKALLNQPLITLLDSAYGEKSYFFSLKLALLKISFLSQKDL